MQGPDLHPLCDDFVRRDVDIILWSMRLQQIRRFTNQRFWEIETRDAEYAARVEPGPALESVADHSWHVADCVLILANYCPGINVRRALEIAIVHDKMEIIITDWNPLGRDGTGLKSHAFNPERRHQKNVAERDAIRIYLNKLRPDLRAAQESLLTEALECATPESKFVKAVDKLQALAFVQTKKNGEMHDRHIKFSIRYSRQACFLCPPLSQHFEELRTRLISDIATRRKVSTGYIESLIADPDQLPLFDEESDWQ